MGSYINNTIHMSNQTPLRGNISIIAIYTTIDGDYCYQCSIGAWSFYEECFTQPKDIRDVDLIIKKDDPNHIILIKEEYNHFLKQLDDFSKSLSYTDLDIVKTAILDFHNNELLKNQEKYLRCTPLDTSHGGFWPVLSHREFCMTHKEYYNFRRDKLNDKKENNK